MGHSSGHQATELTPLPVMVIPVAAAILSVGGCRSGTQQVRAVLRPSGCPLYLQWANTLSYPFPQSQGQFFILRPNSTPLLLSLGALLSFVPVPCEGQDDEIWHKG